VHEAVLASLVDAAVKWYRNKRVMPDPPASVVESTAKWRMSADLLLRYLSDRLVFDIDAHVRSKELYEDFSDWLKDHGHAAWSDQHFTARLAQHPRCWRTGQRRSEEFGRQRAKRCRGGHCGSPAKGFRARIRRGLASGSALQPMMLNRENRNVRRGV